METRLEKKMKEYGDLFLNEKGNLFSVCKKYDISKEEMEELMDILSNIDYLKYQQLCEKYSYLKEREEKKFEGKSK